LPATVPESQSYEAVVVESVLLWVTNYCTAVIAIPDSEWFSETPVTVFDLETIPLSAILPC